MSDNLAKISIDKEIIGLGNIVISDIDGKIFINNTNQIDAGVKNSLAVYSSDGQSLTGSGLKCQWDRETGTLYIDSIESKKLSCPDISNENISSKKITAENIDTEYLRAEHLYVKDYADSLKFAVKNWLGFTSKDDNSITPFKIKNIFNPETEKETLGIITNDYLKGKTKVSLGIDDERIYFKNILNLKEDKIESAVGKEGDLKGDFVFDGENIYYCTKNYDGESSIWKRLKTEDL